jgi:hypothetical protein
MSVQEDKNPSGEPKPWLLVVILLAVIAILAINGWWLHGDANGRGTFGDMFGGVNALFSGAAFSVLAFTLLLQRYELKLQREELAETRKVMEAQRKEMTRQALTQQLQQFENTFFQLLKTHGDILQAIDIVRPADNLVTRGRDCFEVFRKRLKSAYNSVPGPDELERVKEAYRAFYNDHESDLGHYFRHLYHVLKFIDENPQVDRERYRGFFRAQLSANELTLLFYNCVGHHGERCKPLLEKYGMLKHLSAATLLKVEHADFFEKKAFMPTEGPLD